MQVRLGDHLKVEAEHIRAAAQVAQREPCGFRHHVAKAARRLQRALALAARDLDVEDVAADRRPREALHDAGDALRAPFILLVLGATKQRFGLLQAQHARALTALRHIERCLATQALHDAVQAAHAGFARVLLHDALHHGGRDREALLGEAVTIELLRQDVPQTDLHLLLQQVAGQLQDLHAVPQWLGDLRQHVRRRQEHHLRQIERDVEVVVRERVVLLGVEHFEQGGAGIAAEVTPELVDLVEQQHGVVGAARFQSLQDAARHRADVGAAMAFDLRLVAHATEREPPELAPHRARDAAAEARLADAGRAREAQDRALVPRLELAHREELEDAILHLVESVMVLGEHFGCAAEVRVVRGALRPRQRCDPIEVVADHAVLGGLDRRRLEPQQLLVGALLRDLRQLRFRDRRLDALQLGAARILLFAELLADQFDLLAQEVVLLRLLGLAANLALQLLVDLGDLDLGHHELEHELQSLFNVRSRKHALAVLHLAQHATREVRELRRVLEVEQGRGEARVHLLLHLGELAQVLLQHTRERLGLLALRGDLDDLLHAHDEMRLLPHGLHAARTTQALRHRRHVAVRQAQRLEHARDDTLLVDAVDARSLLLGVALQHDEEMPVVRFCLGDDLARLRRVQQQGHHQRRERHCASQREREQGVRQLLLYDHAPALLGVRLDDDSRGRVLRVLGVRGIRGLGRILGISVRVHAAVVNHGTRAASSFDARAAHEKKQGTKPCLPDNGLAPCRRRSGCTAPRNTRGLSAKGSCLPHY